MELCPRAARAERQCAKLRLQGRLSLATNFMDVFVSCLNGLLALLGVGKSQVIPSQSRAAAQW